MKFVVIMTRKAEFGPDNLAPHIPAEFRRATELYAEGTFREIYTHSDGKATFLVTEARIECKALEAVQSLPPKADARL